MPINKENTRHYKWGNNCKSWVFHTSKNLSVKLESMPSGSCEQLHFHSRAIQFFYMLKGTAIFYLNGERNEVNAHAAISISPKTHHYVVNESKQSAEFLVISHPNTDTDKIPLDM